MIPECEGDRRRWRVGVVVVPPDLVDDSLPEASDRSDIRIGCHTMIRTKRRRWRYRERRESRERERESRDLFLCVMKMSSSWDLWMDIYTQNLGGWIVGR
jgi:hypothetical protein